MDALQNGNDPSLPPLMNPSMLEASDDLTNLSHLNEPAGTLSVNAAPSLLRPMVANLSVRSSPSNSPQICPERDIHIQRYSVNSNKSFCPRRFPLCSRYGASIRW